MSVVLWPIVIFQSRCRSLRLANQLVSSLAMNAFGNVKVPIALDLVLKINTRERTCAPVADVC